MARLNINGKVRDIDVEGDTPLLWVIREQAGLTGTKYGCGVAQCGSRTVHVNGKAQRSCALPVSAVKTCDRIVTIGRGQPDRHAHPRLGPVHQRVREPGEHRRRQGQAAAAGPVGTAGRRPARLHVPQPAHRAAEKAGWGTPLPKGVYRGIAQFMGLGPSVLNAVFAATGKSIRNLPLKNAKPRA